MPVRVIILHNILENTRFTDRTEPIWLSNQNELLCPQTFLQSLLKIIFNDSKGARGVSADYWKGPSSYANKLSHLVS